MTFKVTLGQNGRIFDNICGWHCVRWEIHRASRCTLPCLTILNPKNCGRFQQRLKRQKNPPHWILSPL